MKRLTFTIACLISLNSFAFLGAIDEHSNENWNYSYWKAKTRKYTGNQNSSEKFSEKFNGLWVLESSKSTSADKTNRETDILQQCMPYADGNVSQNGKYLSVLVADQAQDFSSLTPEDRQKLFKYHSIASGFENYIDQRVNYGSCETCDLDGSLERKSTNTSYEWRLDEEVIEALSGLRRNMVTLVGVKLKKSSNDRLIIYSQTGVSSLLLALLGEKRLTTCTYVRAQK